MDPRLYIIAGTFVFLLVALIIFVAAVTRSRRVERMQPPVMHTDWPNAGTLNDGAVDTDLEGLELTTGGDSLSANLLTPIKTGEWQPPEVPAPAEELADACLASRIEKYEPATEPAEKPPAHEAWVFSDTEGAIGEPEAVCEAPHPLDDDEFGAEIAALLPQDAESEVPAALAPADSAPELAPLPPVSVPATTPAPSPVEAAVQQAAEVDHAPRPEPIPEPIAQTMPTWAAEPALAPATAAERAPQLAPEPVAQPAPAPAAQAAPAPQETPAAQPLPQVQQLPAQPVVWPAQMAPWPVAPPQFYPVPYYYGAPAAMPGWQPVAPPSGQWQYPQAYPPCPADPGAGMGQGAAPADTPAPREAAPAPARAQEPVAAALEAGLSADEEPEPDFAWAMPRKQEPDVAIEPLQSVVAPAEASPTPADSSPEEAWAQQPVFAPEPLPEVQASPEPEPVQPATASPATEQPAAASHDEVDTAMAADGTVQGAIAPEPVDVIGLVAPETGAVPEFQPSLDAEAAPGFDALGALALNLGQEADPGAEAVEGVGWTPVAQPPADMASEQEFQWEWLVGPIPEDEPQPENESEPVMQVQPEPVHAQVPVPEPAVASVGIWNLLPAPEPTPVPEPAPEPTPVPEPAAEPEPEPAPEPELASRPRPVAQVASIEDPQAQSFWAGILQGEPVQPAADEAPPQDPAPAPEQPAPPVEPAPAPEPPAPAPEPPAPEPPAPAPAPIVAPVSAAELPPITSGAKRPRAVTRVATLDPILETAAHSSELPLRPLPAEKIESPEAENLVLATPVEMWFGDARIGVKAGTATFDRFRKYADTMLNDLRDAKQ